MGVKVSDFTSHMPMLHSSRKFSLPRPIVECHEETSARLPKLVRASAAPQHPYLSIHVYRSYRLYYDLSVMSQIERDITSTFNLMYACMGRMAIDTHHPIGPIHLSVMSQTERGITSTFNLMYAWRDHRFLSMAWRTIGVLSCSTARTVLDPVCSNQGVMESYEFASCDPSSNC